MTGPISSEFTSNLLGKTQIAIGQKRTITASAVVTKLWQRSLNYKKGTIQNKSDNEKA